MNLIIPVLFRHNKNKLEGVACFHINDFFGGGKEQFELTLISNIKEMIIKIHEEFTALEYLGLIIKF